MNELLMKELPSEVTNDQNDSRKVIIGNVDGESLVGDISRHTPEMFAAASIIANRLIWFVEDHDILLLPYPVSSDFMEYLCGLMEVDTGTVKHIVPPMRDAHETKLLRYDVLSDHELQLELQNLTNGYKEWGILAYYHDRAVAELTDSIRTKIHPNVNEFLLQGGSEVLNSKTEFKRMAASHGVPVPPGYNCYSQSELFKLISDLIDQTGSVIVKQDVNAGGDGNIVVTTDTSIKNSKGATETLHISEENGIENITDYLWKRLIGYRNNSLVVEVYYQTQAVFYSEYHIGRQELKPTLLNFGDMRMEPVWNGFEIPTVSMNAYSLGEFISNSTVLADIARERGYEGNINIDAFLTMDGELLFSEINGRNGGCSHIHHVAQKLYGVNYADHYMILTRNKIKVGPDFKELLMALKDESLLVQEKGQEGVIILTEDIGRTGTIEYMVIGKGRERALILEERALAVFERSRESC
ncbi:hypothetical protein F0342_11825 [Bacillus sp. CH30_1T]|uniref:preATP grasp domain-containing protein n=1 Tax=Bacillus sp. CH30_1T TaxID=2604836 RepID=UPI0011EC9664|nr:peptide ligase PGM1-related protein [Bacillus sp. CH30_1T]KAA0563501.1 hypothetical protein F0342_11825 [Bacillus sp. CH30_1T]